MDPTLARRSAALELSLRALDAAVVAFSGGVDSALLTAVAHDVLGDRCVAVTARSPSVATRELDDARALAARFGWNHVVVDTHETEHERYARNDSDRCYWCKTELLAVLGPIAAARGARVLVGTNADDLGDYRPGIRAASEHGALTPLADAGLTKADVRALCAERGLPIAAKPASPCLASRVAYGVRVTPERLRRIEAAENELRALGFGVVRVRDHGDLARVEVPAPDIERAAALQERVSERLRELGWRYATLDLTGFRSGSMNEVLAPPALRAAP